MNHDNPTRVAGKLVPEDENSHIFKQLELIISLAQNVSMESNENHLDEWGKWKDACLKLEPFGLTYGNDVIPIIEFSMDEEWNIEFDLDDFFYERCVL